MKMLDSQELNRYKRQIILPELGIAGQQKLKNARVLMVGAGGLGCPVLQYLVAAGVGFIGIVDDDTVDETNLHRQILYSAEDIGKNKAQVAVEKLSVINPHVKFSAYPVRLSMQNADQLFRTYDLVIDGSDNFPTRYLVNDTCAVLNLPLVFGSLFKFEGQVSVFNYCGGPDYRSIFPEPPGIDEVPNCAEIGVIGVLPGIIGTYMANEAIKVICEMGEVLSGRLLCINALDGTSNIFKIANSSGSEQKKHSIQAGTINKTGDEITAEELIHLQNNKAEEVYLVDVRENYEFEDHNLGGVNIPLYELQDRINELPEDMTIVFYCQTGQRSKMAVQLLKEIFKAKVYSLKGGMK
ncbi:HesA/MoeB/ThiF family protein [Daejeonella sp. H1SJ63]|uniref:HesA/MoeB/ThiF family protein n=1 Tax=Daejeonella sp. H1SJ63 TaxID=3034145 RepID=UPI0023EB67B5|nr:HesA/MoeB/ThiF family protein [Daejeonella sp. H1SJ63]